MSNSYIQLLEQIIMEMNTDLARGTSEISSTDYDVWTNFLRTVHPESTLFQKESILVDHDFGKILKAYSDIRQIMMLAEEHQYPTWFIQPQFTDEVRFDYEQGTLKGVFIRHDDTWEQSEGSPPPDIPKQISGFTGSVAGARCGNQGDAFRYIAYDVNRNTDFLQKMACLEQAGFPTIDFVLFPTDTLPTVSSTTLETSFKSYIAKAQEQGLPVDGVVIISDTPLIEADNHTSTHRISFSPLISY